MEMSELFKSVIDADRAPIVICSPDHTVVYVNPAAAERYAGMGAPNLLGSSILDCHPPAAAEKLKKAVELLAAAPGKSILYESRNDSENKDVYIVALRNGNGELIGYYEKHEYRCPETADFYELID